MNSHPQTVSTGKCVASLCAVLIVLGILLLPGNGIAQVMMSDGGSTAFINTGNTGTLGMNSWTVLNGQNQLNQQWFWYSINGSAPQPINTLGGLSVLDNGYGAQGLNDVIITYANAQLSASIEYQLTGFGNNSGNADLAEGIAVQNLSGTALTLSFYQYSYFGLLGYGTPNSVVISGSPGMYTGAQQTAGGVPNSTGIAEVIAAPDANRAEAASYNQTLTELNTPSYLNLDDIMSAGPGNVTWGFQWNATLQPYGSVDGQGDPTDTLAIAKDKGLGVQIVPEPSTLALVALGMGALGLTLRRKLT